MGVAVPPPTKGPDILSPLGVRPFWLGGSMTLNKLKPNQEISGGTYGDFWPLLTW